ncbi:MAG TPA: (2Fe-2S) ferredoxin domain-containing protein [Planctomycetes bacterium]|nr:(2Fe-2S) ferredoxin domain-containing protein [Planctomycetota bacterium]
MSIGYDIHVFVCENERPEDHPRGSCSRRGGRQIRRWFKEAMSHEGLTEKTRVNKSGCLAHCESGPIVVIYPQGVWYRPETQEDVVEIVQSHLLRGRVVEHLLLENKDEETP